MPKRTIIALWGSLLVVVGVLALGLGAPNAQAQRGQPVPYTPGVPLFTVTNTPNPQVCLPAPLPLKAGDVAFIKSGVNVRAAPSASSALVWNTVYNNLDKDGRVIDDPKSIAVTILEGAVCEGGFYWWRVAGLPELGWVAEGRPDRGGYFFVVAGVDFSTCPEALYSFRVGESATLFANARVRAVPSLSGQVLTVAPYQSQVSILEGSRCADGLRWWRVRAVVVGETYEGWMSESEDGFYYLVPRGLPSLEDGTLCSAPPRFLYVGARAFVNDSTGNTHALRAAPNANSALLATLVNNVPLTIEDGPVCSGNLNWWQVRVLGGNVQLIGWLAEGSRGVGYWIGTNETDEFGR